MNLAIIRVAIYLRVSSEGQVYDSNGRRIEDGSLEVQKQRAIAHVRATCQSLGRSFEIKYIIEDAGKSAKDTNREGYQALLQLIDERLIDWVVASELSRFNRDTYDYLFFKNLCKKNNVEIVYVGSAFRERDDLTDLMETMLAAYAEFERKMTALRVKRNIHSRLKTDGKINGASAILGLVKCSKRRGHFVLDLNQQEALVKLLNLYLSSTSMEETVKRAKEEGIKDSDGDDLKIERFRIILKNVEWRYSGLWYFRAENELEQIIKLDHGPLISEDLCQQVIEKRNQYALKTSRCGTRNFIYLLSNLLKGKDGEKLSGHIGHGRTKDYRYYYNKKLKMRINAIETEEIIEKRVIQYFKDAAIFKKMISETLVRRNNKSDDLKRGIKVLKEEHALVNTQVNTLVDQLANPNLSVLAIETVTKKISELEILKSNKSHKIAAMELAVTELEGIKDLINIQEQVEKYANGFKKLTRVQKKTLLEKIFEKIEVVDEYSLRLHIKKAPVGGAFLHSLPKSCDSELNGGSNRT